MYNSQGHSQPARRNVLRSNSEQNGFQSGGGQQQWGGGDSSRYPQQAPVGPSSYPQYNDPGRDQYGAAAPQAPPQLYHQYSSPGREQPEVDDAKSFGEIRSMFGKSPGQQQQSGAVRMNARPGSTSYSSRKPTFRKIDSGGSPLGDMGYVPKNQPPAYSQSRYMPASMRSPPVNRRQRGGDSQGGYPASDTPAWEGTLRSSGGPHAWEDQNGVRSSGGGAGDYGSSLSEASGEPHSARYYQLINENKDQLEEYMKGSQPRSYPTGAHGSQGYPGGSTFY